MVKTRLFLHWCNLKQGKIMFSNLDSVHLGNEEKVEDVPYMVENGL